MPEVGATQDKTLKIYDTPTGKGFFAGANPQSRIIRYFYPLSTEASEPPNQP